LANTLINLKNAGIQVEIAVDKRQSKVLGSDIQKLKDNHIPVYIKKTGILEHNKYAIIDDGVVIVIGSWNWSRNAEFQDNSVVILSNCQESAFKILNDFSRIKQRDQ
jgi:phosphatidylserine/phosphatidylglycerophosphate/cardiolipin synthase-like enzyme